MNCVKHLKGNLLQRRLQARCIKKFCAVLAYLSFNQLSFTSLKYKIKVWKYLYLETKETKIWRKTSTPEKSGKEQWKWNHTAQGPKPTPLFSLFWTSAVKNTWSPCTCKCVVVKFGHLWHLDISDKASLWSFHPSPPSFPSSLFWNVSIIPVHTYSLGTQDVLIHGYVSKALVTASFRLILRNCSINLSCIKGWVLRQSQGKVDISWDKTVFVKLPLKHQKAKFVHKNLVNRVHQLTAVSSWKCART